MSKYKFNFEDLRVYQSAIEFGEFVNILSDSFPRKELYNLSSKFRRAADSIALNIAEGYPGSDKQLVKHLNIAIYSSNECVTCSTKARLRGYYHNNEDEKVRKIYLILLRCL